MCKSPIVLPEIAPIHRPVFKHLFSLKFDSSERVLEVKKAVAKRGVVKYLSTVEPELRRNVFCALAIKGNTPIKTNGKMILRIVNRIGTFKKLFEFDSFIVSPYFVNKKALLLHFLLLSRKSLLLTLFQDANGDGIPNALDPDWVKPLDGTGNQFGKMNARLNGGFGNGFRGANAGMGTGTGICDGSSPKGISR